LRAKGRSDLFLVLSLSHTHILSLSLSLSLYIYIYIYIYTPWINPALQSRGAFSRPPSLSATRLSGTRGKSDIYIYIYIVDDSRLCRVEERFQGGAGPGRIVCKVGRSHRETGHTQTHDQNNTTYDHTKNYPLPLHNDPWVGVDK